MPISRTSRKEYWYVLASNTSHRFVKCLGPEIAKLMKIQKFVEYSSKPEEGFRALSRGASITALMRLEQGARNRDNATGFRQSYAEAGEAQMASYLQVSSTEWLEVVSDTLHPERVSLRCVCSPDSLRRCVEDWLKQVFEKVDSYVLLHEDPIVGDVIKAFVILLGVSKVFEFTIECMDSA